MIPEHSQIIIAAGRKALRPHGFKQKGRSRTFLADHGFWACVVEFQPSSWSKGTYLNVAAHWLWTEKDYLSFDLGPGGGSSRLTGFVSSDVPDFAEHASATANIAAQAAAKLDSELSSIPSACHALEMKALESPLGWAVYHAGIAFGLCNQTKKATEALSIFVESPYTYDWELARQADCKLLLDLLGDEAQFRTEIDRRLAARRAALRFNANWRLP